MLRLLRIEEVLSVDGHGTAVLDLAAPLSLACGENGIYIDLTCSISEVEAAVCRIET